MVSSGQLALRHNQSAPAVRQIQDPALKPVSIGLNPQAVRTCTL